MYREASRCSLYSKPARNKLYVQLHMLLQAQLRVPRLRNLQSCRSTRCMWRADGCAVWFVHSECRCLNLWATCCMKLLPSLQPDAALHLECRCRTLGQHVNIAFWAIMYSLRLLCERSCELVLLKKKTCAHILGKHEHTRTDKHTRTRTDKHTRDTRAQASLGETAEEFNSEHCRV